MLRYYIEVSDFWNELKRPKIISDVASPEDLIIVVTDDAQLKVCFWYRQIDSNIAVFSLNYNTKIVKAIAFYLLVLLNDFDINYVKIQGNRYSFFKKLFHNDNCFINKPFTDIWYGNIEKGKKYLEDLLK